MLRVQHKLCHFWPTLYTVAVACHARHTYCYILSRDHVILHGMDWYMSRHLAVSVTKGLAVSVAVVCMRAL